MTQRQFRQQLQLMLFICVSVCHTKISLFHWLTNVTIDVTTASEQYLKRTVQKQNT